MEHVLKGLRSLMERVYSHLAITAILSLNAFSAMGWAAWWFCCTLKRATVTFLFLIQKKNPAAIFRFRIDCCVASSHVMSPLFHHWNSPTSHHWSPKENTQPWDIILLCVMARYWLSSRAVSLIQQSSFSFSYNRNVNHRGKWDYRTCQWSTFCTKEVCFYLWFSFFFSLKAKREEAKKKYKG